MPLQQQGWQHGLAAYTCREAYRCGHAWARSGPVDTFAAGSGAARSGAASNCVCVVGEWCVAAAGVVHGVRHHKQLRGSGPAVRPQDGRLPRCARGSAVLLPAANARSHRTAGEHHRTECLLFIKQQTQPHPKGCDQTEAHFFECPVLKRCQWVDARSRQRECERGAPTRGWLHAHEGAAEGQRASLARAAWPAGQGRRTPALAGPAGSLRGSAGLLRPGGLFLSPARGPARGGFGRPLAQGELRLSVGPSPRC